MITNEVEVLEGRIKAALLQAHRPDPSPEITVEGVIATNRLVGIIRNKSRWRRARQLVSIALLGFVLYSIDFSKPRERVVYVTPSTPTTVTAP